MGAPEHVDVAVIGAGQAGLAARYCLRRTVDQIGAMLRLAAAA